MNKIIGLVACFWPATTRTASFVWIVVCENQSSLTNLKGLKMGCIRRRKAIEIASQTLPCVFVCAWLSIWCTLRVPVPAPVPVPVIPRTIIACTVSSSNAHCVVGSLLNGNNGSLMILLVHTVPTRTYSFNGAQQKRTDYGILELPYYHMQISLPCMWRNINHRS